MSQKTIKRKETKERKKSKMEKTAQEKLMARMMTAQRGKNQLPDNQVRITITVEHDPKEETFKLLKLQAEHTENPLSIIVGCIMGMTNAMVQNAPNKPDPDTMANLLSMARVFVTNTFEQALSGCLTNAGYDLGEIQRLIEAKRQTAQNNLQAWETDDAKDPDDTNNPLYGAPAGTMLSTIDGGEGTDQNANN